MPDAPTLRDPPGAAFPPPEPAAGGSLAVFFLLTFAIAWTCFVALARGVPLGSPAGQAIRLLGVFSPSLVALGLAWRTGGAGGVRAALARIAPARASAGLVVFALTYLAIIKLTAAALLRLTGGSWPRFGDTPLILIPFAIALSTPVQAGEELGWRGFALPRLAARMGLAPASVVLGILHAAWHLPFFFTRGTDTFGQSFPMYVLQVTGINVALAWVWARSGRTLLLPMLLHAAVNNTKGIVPAGVPGASDPWSWHASAMAWTAVGLLWVVAIGLLVDMARSGSGRTGDHTRFSVAF